MRHGLHQYEEALALGRAHRLPEERLEGMAQEYFRLLLDTKQEERAAALKEKEVCALFVLSCSTPCSWCCSSFRLARTALTGWLINEKTVAFFCTSRSKTNLILSCSVS